MMNSCVLQRLNHLSSYLKVHGAKINLDANGVPVCIYNNSKAIGFYNIANLLAKSSKHKLIPQSNEERCQVSQWFEYSLLSCLTMEPKLILQELNSIFMYHTYLVNDKLSLADIILYFAVYSLLENLNYLDKEKYVHLCRWFDNMQQDNQLRQKNKLIDFNTIYLAGVAPARH